MSVYSYTSYVCEWPESVEFDHSSFVAKDAELRDGRYYVNWYGDTGYEEDVVRDLVAMFGKPLDKVPGLSLYLHYETDDDGHFESKLIISDGKCRYEESEIVFNERPMSECPIELDYGLDSWERRKNEKLLARYRDRVRSEHGMN